MTLIIAKQCKDGVVLAADRRELRGLEPREGCKIREVTIYASPQNFTVLLAGAGVGSFWEEVARCTAYYPDTETLPTFRDFSCVVLGLNSTVMELSKMYSEGLDDKLGCVVAGLEDISSGKVKIYSFCGAGFAETQFFCLGSGDKYALPMSDILLNKKDITTERAVQLMPLIFLLVERVHLGVAGGPDIFIWKDGKQAFQMPAKEVEEARKKAGETLEGLSEVIHKSMQEH